jgi:hypothetical protein
LGHLFIKHQKELLAVRGLATPWQARVLMYSSERFNLAAGEGHAALVVSGAWRNGEADDAGAADEVTQRLIGGPAVGFVSFRVEG